MTGQPQASPPAGSHQKPSVDPATLQHADLLEGEFWRRIPAWSEISDIQFRDHHWQAKNSITKVPQLLAALQGLVSEEFIADVAEGFRRAPMTIRVSPYVLSLIDWNAPLKDPLRTQFIPLGSRLRPDHPKLGLDSLHERADMPVPGLTHRYPDKALFLALDTCPVYCRFCTRSYAVGLDTDEVQKFHLRATPDRWRQVFDYIGSRPSSRTSWSRVATRTSCAPTRSRSSAKPCSPCRTSAGSGTRPRVPRSCRRSS